MPSLIENTFCNGGCVGKVNVMVARLYSLYYEPSQGLYMSEKAALKRLQETEKERESTIDQVRNYFLILCFRLYYLMKTDYSHCILSECYVNL